MIALCSVPHTECQNLTHFLHYSLLLRLTNTPSSTCSLFTLFSLVSRRDARQVRRSKSARECKLCLVCNIHYVSVVNQNSKSEQLLSVCLCVHSSSFTRVSFRFSCIPPFVFYQFESQPRIGVCSKCVCVCAPKPFADTYTTSQTGTHRNCLFGIQTLCKRETWFVVSAY